MSRKDTTIETVKTTAAAKKRKNRWGDRKDAWQLRNLDGQVMEQQNV